MKQAYGLCGQVILMKNFMKSFEKKEKKSCANFTNFFQILKIEKKA